MNPKVSLIMPIYNGETHLRASLDSLIAQTFSDFEIIIIDDCSSDSSSAIIREYAQKDLRIKVFRNESNIGLTKSLNKAIKLSSGQYIARMDAGDTSEPNRFSEQVAFLDQHADYGLVGSWATIIDESSKKIGKMAWEKTNEEIRKALIKYNPIVHSSIMMRRDVLERAGGYDEKWKYAQDYELYFRMIKHAKIANLPEFLISYRIALASLTIQKNKQQSMFALRARWKAIKEGQFPWWTAIFLLRPLAGSMLPTSFKGKIKDLF